MTGNIQRGESVPSREKERTLDETQRRVCETQRLIIRELCAADLPDLCTLLADPEVMRSSLRGVCDQEASRNFLDWCLASYASAGIGPWALELKEGQQQQLQEHPQEHSRFVGFCGIGPETVDGSEEINLGYRLAPAFWNQGLATEAVRAVLEYAFTQQQLDSIVVIIEPEHLASLRVAEKAGFNDYTERDFHGRRVRLYRMMRQH